MKSSSMLSACCGVLSLFVASTSAQEASSPVIRVTESAQGFLFAEGADKVLFYQRKPKALDGKHRRANYVHPLYDLDGNVLTEDFPADHRHHRGLFWAWHQVWVGDKRVGDPWAIKDFSWEVDNARVSHDAASAGLMVRVLWKSPRWTNDGGQQAPLVRETTTIRVYRAEKNHRKIDFEIRLVAMVEGLRLGGSDDAKGYGGFSMRLRLPADARFTAKRGTVEPQRLSVDAARWMDLSASYGRGGQLAGVTTLCHPSLPGFPQRWILRSSRSMQNPVYPGREPVALSRETPLTLRYRLVVHRGAVDPRAAEAWQAEYERLDFSRSKKAE